MLKQSNRHNANQSRFYIVCASALLNSTVQSNGMQRPVACRTFFAWADFLRTTPNRLIVQHINRLTVLKRRNNDDDNDEIQLI